ncbi:MAG: universal stress protein [Alphaproteobacteria bacterium]|nr:universal stress protein [Alphaproteobacteria bacterium]
MSYKTICAGFLYDDPRNEAVLDAAIHLAVKHGAHLTGLHLVPPLNVPVYAAVPLPNDMVGAYYDAADNSGKAFGETFDARCEHAGVDSREWRGDGHGALVQLEQQAPVTDLFVLAQHGTGDHSWLIGEASMLVGTPIVAVPEMGSYDAFGKTVLLAWAPRRECARAVRDAMPILQQADKVVVFRGDVEDESLDVGIGAYLARHDVAAQVKHVSTGDVSIGDAILNTVTDEGCDMIVMGAYGHSRVREMAFGGATRHVLQHMTAPTLLSH